MKKRSRSIKRKWLLPLLRRRMLIALLLLLQMLLFFYFFLSSSRVSDIVAYAINFFAMLTALFVLARPGESAYKLTWIFVILAFPVAGLVMYLCFFDGWSKRQLSRRIGLSEEKIRPLLRHDLPQDTSFSSDTLPTTVRYLDRYVGFPYTCGDRAVFLPSGEAMYARLKSELEKAEHYIFLEYFIIAHGIVWDSILEILKRKAASGVKVRLIYDDMGCFLLLPLKYRKQLEKYGIETVAFNPFVPFLSVEQNNRDHRKITVIDGRVAFTGGVNLADEYINALPKHGHWADAAIMVEGRAAWHFTLLFLQMWQIANKKQNEDFLTYYPKGKTELHACENNAFNDNEPTSPHDDSTQIGLTVPYADSPLDNENVGEQVYLQVIQSAKRYVYITTPYLVIDEKMFSALTLSAKSGVDVRIITPHVWDKRMVHATTRTYYKELIEVGVKVYEYLPGFMHAKTVVTDDELATVGSINFDYRSLYLHFECGLLLYRHSEVAAVKERFLQYLSQSEEMTGEAKRAHFFVRLKRALLRLLSPLM